MLCCDWLISRNTLVAVAKSWSWLNSVRQGFLRLLQPYDRNSTPTTFSYDVRRSLCVYCRWGLIRLSSLSLYLSLSLSVSLSLSLFLIPAATKFEITELVSVNSGNYLHRRRSRQSFNCTRYMSIHAWMWTRMSVCVYVRDCNYVPRLNVYVNIRYTFQTIPPASSPLPLLYR